MTYEGYGPHDSVGLTDLRNRARTACRAEGVASSWVAMAGTDTLRAALRNAEELRKASIGGSAPAPAPAPAASSAASGGGLLEQALAGLVEQALAGRVARIVADAVEQATEALRDELTPVSTLFVYRPPEAFKTVTGAHPRLAMLVRLLAARQNVWIHGPAGSGKSHGARQAAELLGRSVEMVACSGQTMAQELLGFTSADGQWIETPLARAWKHGRVLVLDEVDRLAADAASALHEALASRILAMPDGPLAAHDDLVVVATANTAGHGGDRTYLSAQAQDAALRDRFAFLAWPYDTDHERGLAVATAGPDIGRSWHALVLGVRTRLASRASRYVVSPRATIGGAALLSAGLEVGEVVESCVRKGMADGDWKDAEPSKDELVAVVTAVAKAHGAKAQAKAVPA